LPTKKVLTGHRRFKKQYEAEKELFDRLAEEGQFPKVLWIGCSDSRVIPEQITGADPGELFTLRNIANIVPPADGSAHAAGAAIEYAILHVGVSHVVICGHTDCGGIKALGAELDGEREPHIVHWLQHARPAWKLVEAAGLPAEERHMATVKANVVIQLAHLRTYRCVCDGENGGTVSLHGWLYNLHTGSVLVYDAVSGDWNTLPDFR
jgi:carbonic anhydrase